MGNAQSYVVSSLSVCCVYIVYVHIYSSYKSLKTHVLYEERLPSFLFLYIKYLTKAVAQRKGFLSKDTTNQPEVVYTVLNCRLQTPLLRSFCGAAGYGWDYPDSDYRDVPLCFPEVLCRRLLLTLITDQDFRLSPAGLVRVRQSLKTLQPVDELKKGPFSLQARVLQYRTLDVGVEVDVCLSAASRTGTPVWESVLTLLSGNKMHKTCRNPSEREDTCQPDECVAENVKQVDLKVSRMSALQSVWFFSPLRLFGCRSITAPSLWMLSVCMAEIEKHKGVGVITAPVKVSAQFKEPLLLPGRVTISFWEKTGNEGEFPPNVLAFNMQRHGGNTSHLTGFINR
ncbi:hypothetical protein NQZ68_014712 [Dissostichus eleginoides]|nr:hypothetical protein NQZ68_014712 [Dissostichus eleginoides]